MNQVLDWLSANTLIISSLAAASITLLAVTILATPWAVSRLPSDYLLRRLESRSLQGVGRKLLGMVRGFIGVLIVLLGLIMMITPGPGVVMILLGISVAEFPGKNRLLVYLATRPNVLASLNWMRRRHDKPPFIDPNVLQ
ncbi:PGPGW domain-containing protein [Granulosicoccus sp. 3-233]|uniref:PGPGW domain-containing protein n=1 Tax=Granulosicoccus sp. 3-233 TaxID=3417969 RepID=UPI003D333C2B